MTHPEVDQRFVELNAQSLTAAANGDLDEANEFAEKSADLGSLLGVALSTYLRTSEHRGVYDHPGAFEAFIAGGGNVDLYRRTSAALASAYPGVGSLMDIGCGNGLALVPALQQAATVPAELELIEPGEDLLNHALAATTATGLPIRITAWRMGLTEFLDAAPTAQRWNLAQSTFALQSIEPSERSTALQRLALRVDRLVIVDFDVPDQKAGTAKQIRSLAARYERGLAEYVQDRDLVAQGFLMPVLLGQISPATKRTNWEHTAEFWQKQVTEAGFGDVQVQPLADYWSALAFLLTATGV